MNDYSLPTRLALGAYRVIERTGALENRFVQDVFQRAYFLYKRTLEDAFAGLLRKHPRLFLGGHIIDIGANIGYTSTLFLRLLSQGYRLFSFEPEARNFEQLERAIARSGRSSQVVALKMAIGAHDGTAELKINPAHHADHRVVAENAETSRSKDTVSVPLRSLDSVLREHGALTPVSFVKIDVQGYELPVFHGMTGLLDANPNIAVAFEYDAQSLGTSRTSGEALISFFKERGFWLSLITHAGDLTPYSDAALQAEIAKRAYVDILATRSHRTLQE